MSKYNKSYAVVYACTITYAHRHTVVQAEGLLEAMVIALDSKMDNEVVSTVVLV
jgi:hypothetical protein